LYENKKIYKETRNIRKPGKKLIRKAGKQENIFSSIQNAGVLLPGIATDIKNKTGS
jgi:hypothetical protein